MTTPLPTLAAPTARSSLLFVRALSIVASIASVAYLAWRTTTLGGLGSWWLSVPLLAAELWAFAAFAVFVAAAWRRPDQPVLDSANSGSFPRVGVFIDARDASVEAIERTLVGAAALDGAGAITLVVRDASSAPLDQLADALTATTRVVTGSSMLTEVAGADSPLALWLDAGQITTPNALRATVPRFDDPRLASCQIAVGWMSANSLARMRGARDQAALNQRVVAPSLSAAGVAPWSGPGSLIRTAALRETVPADEAATTHRVRARLLASGWRTAYEPRELIRGVAPETLAAYLAGRHARTAAAWRAARARDGILRRRGGRLAARLGPAHDLLAATGGLRLLVVAAVTCGVIVSGRLPFDVDAIDVGAPWLLIASLTTLSRRSIAGETMTIGDWTRQAWRTLPADGPALLGIDRRPDRADPGTASSALGTLWPLVIIILVLDLALLVRASTLISADALPRFSGTDRVLVLLWCLALLAPLADVVLLAARKRQRRAAPRLETSLPITLGETTTRTIDISPSGVGVLVDAAPAVDSITAFELTLPGLGDRAERISGTAAVRSATADASGRVRVGLEFINLGPDARAALIGYCGVGHAIEFVDRAPTPLEPAHLDVDAGTGRRPVSGLTGLAVAAGVAVVLAGPSAGVAGADETLAVERVCVTTVSDEPVPGAIVTRVGPESDNVLGATDGAGCLAVAPETDDVTYAADIGGTGARASSTDAVGGTLTITVTGRSVTLIDADGLEATFELRTFAAGWSDPIEVDGSATLAPDASIEAVELRWGETTHVVPLDGDIVVVLARLVSDPGVEILEVDRGNGWESFVDGTQMLPGPLAVVLADGTVVKLDVPGDHEMSIPSGTISRLDLAVPTPEPVPTAAPTSTPEPAAAETPDTELTPTAEPTSTPEPEPTPTPTAEPSAAPTPEPESAPTADAVTEPTPTAEPEAES